MVTSTQTNELVDSSQFLANRFQKKRKNLQTLLNLRLNTAITDLLAGDEINSLIFL